MTFDELKSLEFVAYASGNTQAIYKHSCGDRRGHLYVNIASGGWICWRCSAKGFLTGKDKEALQKVHLVIAPQAPVAPLTLSSIDARLVCLGTPEYEYLQSRGISDSQIIRYRIMRTDVPRYARKILFPIFDGGYRGFIARAIDPGAQSKYVNSPGFSRRDTIFNFDNVKDSSCVYIAEGIFSALAIGYSAVALFGKHAAAPQVLRLLSLPRTTRYVVALDGDARREALALLYTLRAAGREASMMLLPLEHDPDSVPDLSAVPVVIPSQLAGIRFRLNQLAKCLDAPVCRR